MMVRRKSVISTLFSGAIDPLADGGVRNLGKWDARLSAGSGLIVTPDVRHAFEYQDSNQSLVLVLVLVLNIAAQTFG